MKRISLSLLVVSTSFLLAGGDVAPQEYESAPMVQEYHEKKAYNPNPDTIYTDFNSGLIWMDQKYTENENRLYAAGNKVFRFPGTLEPYSGKVGSYSYAVAYCANTNYAGYSDWRLPTRAEFETALSAPEWYQAFRYEQHGYFWTSTSEGNRQISVYTREGYGYESSKFEAKYIRCLREAREDLFTNS